MVRLWSKYAPANLVLCLLFLGVCLGTIEGCSMKQHLPVYIPKRLSDGGTGTFTPTVKFQMLDNCLLMKIQLEGQLRIGRGKPKSFGFVQL